MTKKKKKINEILSKVHLGMTQKEVKKALGEPEDWNNGTRKYPKPSLLVYGGDLRIEFHFTYGDDGELWMVYREDKKGNPEHLLK